MSEARCIKDEARRMVEELPAEATWTDFARLVTERQRAEGGIDVLGSRQRQPNRRGLFWLSMGVLLFVVLAMTSMALLVHWLTT